MHKKNKMERPGHLLKAVSVKKLYPYKKKKNNLIKDKKGKQVSNKIFQFYKQVLLAGHYHIPCCKSFENTNLISAIQTNKSFRQITEY